MITLETWENAQFHERKWHDKNPLTREQAEVYYQGYFDHLDIDRDCKGKTIIEIGSADIPALSFCENVKGIIIEPLPSDKLLLTAKEKGIELIKLRAEDYYFPKVDEVWMFNILQHVINPDVIIQKSLVASNCVRFFEPIEFGTDRMHLHNFTMDYFKQFFQDVRRYERHEGLETFHKHQCAYGVNYKI